MDRKNPVKAGLNRLGTALEGAALDAAVKKEMGAKMERVEARIAEAVDASPTMIAEMSRYILCSGGKRLRPLLLLLSARMTGYRGEMDEEYALIYEFLHSATLVHDDIIDEADTRRGRPSVHAQWGRTQTVLLGDHVFTTGMDRAIAAGNVEIMRIISQTVLQLIEGELGQLERRFDLTLTMDEHLEILRKKTACLFAACARTGALLGAGDAERADAMGRYGQYLGLAFQLTDDLLDYTGDEKVIGKPVLSDLREGRITLPILYLLRDGDAEAKAFVTEMVETRAFDTLHGRRLIHTLRDAGAFEQARGLVRYYANKAAEELAPFPEGRAKDILAAVPGYVTSRTR